MVDHRGNRSGPPPVSSASSRDRPTPGRCKSRLPTVWRLHRWSASYPGWGGIDDAPFEEGFYIWSLADPEDPRLLGHYKTGGLGTHRNYYDGGRYVHATALPNGYDGHIYQAVDISDPANPREISRWWRKGQWVAGGEAGVPFGTMLHGGAYVHGNRAYLPYSAGGFVILDISDISAPRLVGDFTVLAAVPEFHRGTFRHPAHRAQAGGG